MFRAPTLELAFVRRKPRWSTITPWAISFPFLYIPTDGLRTFSSLASSIWLIEEPFKRYSEEWALHPLMVKGGRKIIRDKKEYNAFITKRVSRLIRIATAYKSIKINYYRASGLLLIKMVSFSLYLKRYRRDALKCPQPESQPIEPEHFQLVPQHQTIGCLFAQHP